MKKPRTIKNALVLLSCHENDKGKRSIEINIMHDAMPVQQAKTVMDRLSKMIAWCSAKA